MRKEDTIEQLLNDTPEFDVPDSLLAKLQGDIRLTPTPVAIRTSVWSTVMTSRITQFTVAAAIIIAVILGVNLVSRTQSLALAEVLDNILQIRACSWSNRIESFGPVGAPGDFPSVFESDALFSVDHGAVLESFTVDQNGNREDFRGAYEDIAKDMESGDLIVAGWPEIGRHYLDVPVENAVEVKRGELAEMEHRVWFVVDNRSGFPSKLQAWIESNSQLIAVRDVYIPGKLMMMRVFLYDPAIQ